MQAIETTVTSRQSYQLPFGTDSSFGDLIVAEIGIPLINFYGEDQAIAPVRFTDGTYGLISCRGEQVDLLESNNPIVEAYIKASATMPIVEKKNGLQQSIRVRVTTFDTGQTVIADIHYNEDTEYLDNLISIG